MDSESSYHAGNPERLKSLACNARFSEGNTLLHQFVIDNSDPNDSGSAIYIHAVLMSMSDVPASIVNASNRHGYSALHLAVLKNHPLMVKKLLYCLVNIDVNARCDKSQDTPIHLAAQLGHLSVIRELLDKGADIDIINRDRERALCVAVRSSHLDIVKVLVNGGANVNELRRWILHPWGSAIFGNLTILEFLVSSGADIKVYGWCALHHAAQSGNLDILKFLLDRGINYERYRPTYKNELLFSALQSGNLATVVYLVNYGADVNAKDRMNYTPLHTVEAYKSLEIVEFLIDQGADLDARDEMGCTPLHVAANSGNVGMAGFLIGKGADLNAAAAFGVNPYGGVVEYAKFILDEGAYLPTIIVGWTPLHFAASRGYDAVIRVLLDGGTDVNAKTKSGKTPLDIAVEKGNQSCIDALAKR